MGWKRSFGLWPSYKKDELSENHSGMETFLERIPEALRRPELSENHSGMETEALSLLVMLSPR